MTTIVVRAPDSQQAMDEVLRRLGDDAFILSTTNHDGQVEIHASDEPPPPRKAVVTTFADVLKSRGVTIAPARPAEPPPDPVAEAAAAHMNGIAEELEGREGKGVLAHLVRQLFDPLAGDDILTAPPPRIILVGPPGGGKSLLAARLAAGLRLAGQVAMPRILQPRVGLSATDDRLRGWCRLMDQPLERPLLDSLLQDAAFAPGEGRPAQIIDLSDLPALPVATLAELSAPEGSVIWLVLPAGLSARRIAALAAPLQGLTVRVVLTGIDLCKPSEDELACLAKFGLPLAMHGLGTGIVNCLQRSGKDDLHDWARGWVLEADTTFRPDPVAAPAPVTAATTTAAPVTSAVTPAEAVPEVMPEAVPDKMAEVAPAPVTTAPASPPPATITVTIISPAEPPLRRLREGR